jgi:hypothetical protein
MIMRARNPLGPALSSVDKDEPAVEAREVDRGREAAGAAAHDDGIDGIEIFAETILRTHQPSPP